MRDVLALQGEVARAIARRIQATLAPDVEQRLAARPVRPDVYEDYLKGRYFLYQTTAEGLQKAEEFFTLALTKDPAAALAHAGLADVNIVRSFSGLVPPRTALEQAQTHAVRAIELDDRLSDAHASLAWINFQNWDWAGAEKEFRRALQLNPGSAVARGNYAQFLAARGRTQYVMAFSVALLYANAGEHRAALDWLERAYQQRGALLEYIRVSPEFEALRPDPRFRGLLRRLDLAGV